MKFYSQYGQASRLSARRHDAIELASKESLCHRGTLEGLERVLRMGCTGLRHKVVDMTGHRVPHQHAPIELFLLLLTH